MPLFKLPQNIRWHLYTVVPHSLLVLASTLTVVYCCLVGANLTIQETKVEFPNGKHAIRVYSDPDTLSGIPVNRHFCGTCGCPLFSLTSVHEGMVTLNLGIYPTIPEPERDNFVKDRQSLQKPIDGAVQYKREAKGKKMPGSV